MIRKLFFILPLLLLSGKVVPKEKTKDFCISVGVSLVCCKKILRGPRGYTELTDCNKNVKEVINAASVLIYE